MYLNLSKTLELIKETSKLSTSPTKSARASRCTKLAQTLRATLDTPRLANYIRIGSCGLLNSEQR
jgi:hypothetical protein